MLPVTDLSRFAAKNSNYSCQLQPIHDCKTVFILLQYTAREFKTTFISFCTSHFDPQYFLFLFQPWEGKVLGKRRNGDTFLQNVNIIPVIGKGG